MVWIELVTLLALIQYLVFGALVGRARGVYGVKAPATTGHELFERCYRVQMNTLEQMVAFLPSLWLASRYWPAAVVAAVGAVYLVGRMIYYRAYTQSPARRGLGFMLTMLPTAVLMLASGAGMVMGLLGKGATGG